MITVDQRAADWIRHTVLLRNDEHYEALVRLCACQWDRADTAAPNATAVRPAPRRPA